MTITVLWQLVLLTFSTDGWVIDQEHLYQPETYEGCITQRSWRMQHSASTNEYTELVCVPVGYE